MFINAEMFYQENFLPSKSSRISFKIVVRPTILEKFKFYKNLKTLKRNTYQEIDLRMKSSEI